MARSFLRNKSDGTPYEGRWCDFRYRGVRVSENTRTTTKAEFEKWVREKKREIDSLLDALPGTVPTVPISDNLKRLASQHSTPWPASLTIGKAAERYWNEHLQFNPNDNSKASERSRLLKITSETGTELKLEELTTAHVKTVVSTKLSAGQDPDTIIRDLATLRAMHNMARDVWEYPTLRTVAWKKVMPKSKGTVIDPPTLEHIRRLVDHATTPRLSKVIMFAFLTGLRHNEIKTLQWSNYRPGAEPSIKFKGKGQKEAILPLSSAAISVISSIQPGASSQIFDMTNFEYEWKATRSKAGLPDMRFHDLRHAFATLFQKVSQNPLAVQKALRHSDIATSSIYAHVDNAQLLPSLDAIGTQLTNSLKLSNNTLPTSDETQGDLFGDKSAPE